MKPIAIKNKDNWLNHSHVLTRGRMTAGDLAEINNGMVSVEVVNNVPVVITKAGNQNILKVRRMVVQGTVAVLLNNGDDEPEKYEVSLPEQAEQLLPDDLDYICEQIDARSKPMSAEEQKRFLNGAGAHSEKNLSLVSPSLKSL